MSYPVEFVKKVRVLLAEKYSLPAGVVEEILTGQSKPLADSLKVLSQGPSPAKILELLDSKNYVELRTLAEVGISADELLRALKENWRQWCPNDPPGHFRASAFQPEGELVEF